MIGTINTGAPHFKSIAKQHRQSNYSFVKFIFECIDNIIKKCSHIKIDTDIDTNGRLQEVRISDNYLSGFENINNEGINNPMNMGHIKLTHDNDDETSEYGVGLKAGSISCANQLEIITLVNGIYYKIICDFIKMEREPDVNQSYNPQIQIITENEYKYIHPFDSGSTIKITKIRDTTYHTTNNEEITDTIKKNISLTYSRFLNNCRIEVNSSFVEKCYNFFSDPKCIPFTINKRMYILKNNNDTKYFLECTKKNTFYEYNSNNNKWICIKNYSLRKTELINNGYDYCYTPLNNNVDYCIEINSTFTMYSDYDNLITMDATYIYKDNRLYGHKPLKKHNNGIHNYTVHEINFYSKLIGKELGITYNKEITMDNSNNLINSIKATISDSRSEFSSDVSTGINTALCKKAIDLKLLDILTCNEQKLSASYRLERINKLNSIAINKITISPLSSKLTINNNKPISNSSELIIDDSDESDIDNNELIIKNIYESNIDNNNNNNELIIDDSDESDIDNNNNNNELIIDDSDESDIDNNNKSVIDNNNESNNNELIIDDSDESDIDNNKSNINELIIEDSNESNNNELIIDDSDESDIDNNELIIDDSDESDINNNELIVNNNELVVDNNNELVVDNNNELIIDDSDESDIDKEKVEIVKIIKHLSYIVSGDIEMISFDNLKKIKEILFN